MYFSLDKEFIEITYDFNYMVLKRGRHKKEEFKPLDYKPTAGYQANMRQLLHIIRKEQDPESAAGIEEGNVRRMRNYYLNHIFQAMADLTFFFEAISKYPELQEDFDPDLLDLFGIKRLDVKAENYAFMFNRLMSSMLLIDHEYEEHDFRLQLLSKVQEMILSKMEGASHPLFKSLGASQYVNQDIGKAVTWTKAAAYEIKDVYQLNLRQPYKIIMEKGKPKRIRISKEMAIETFKKNVEENRPSRTFKFDTKEILNS